MYYHQPQSEEIGIKDQEVWSSAAGAAAGDGIDAAKQQLAAFVAAPTPAVATPANAVPPPPPLLAASSLVLAVSLVSVPQDVVALLSM